MTLYSVLKSVLNKEIIIIIYKDTYVKMILCSTRKYWVKLFQNENVLNISKIFW